MNPGASAHPAVWDVAWLLFAAFQMLASCCRQVVGRIVSALPATPQAKATAYLRVSIMESLWLQKAGLCRKVNDGWKDRLTCYWRCHESLVVAAASVAAGECGCQIISVSAPLQGHCHGARPYRAWQAIGAAGIPASCRLPVVPLCRLSFSGASVGSCHHRHAVPKARPPTLARSLLEHIAGRCRGHKASLLPWQFHANSLSNSSCTFPFVPATWLPWAGSRLLPRQSDTVPPASWTISIPAA